MTSKTRISASVVNTLEANSTVWDTAVTGFGVRRQRGPAASYVVTYRTAEGRSRMQTIGRHGAPWKPDTARDEARRILGEVARGEDPRLRNEKNAQRRPSMNCATFT